MKLINNLITDDSMPNQLITEILTQISAIFQNLILVTQIL